MRPSPPIMKGSTMKPHGSIVGPVVATAVLAILGFQFGFFASGGGLLLAAGAGGESSRIPVTMPRLTVLAFHTGHAFEHYGNVVTYIRLKGIVPPSSEPPLGAYSPP